MTKHTKTKHGIKSTEIDHNVMIARVKLKWIKSIKKQDIEIFDLKNIECQNEFKKITSESNFLSSVFEGKNDINEITKKFLKR